MVSKKSNDLINKYNLASDAKEATEKLLNTLNNLPSSISWKNRLVIWWIKRKIISNFKKPIEERITQDEFERWSQRLELAINASFRKKSLKLFKSTGKLLGHYQWLLLISEEAILDKKKSGKYDPNSHFAKQYSNNRRKLVETIKMHKQQTDPFDSKVFSDEVKTVMYHYRHWFLRHVKPESITAESLDNYKRRFGATLEVLNADMKKTSLISLCF